MAIPLAFLLVLTSLGQQPKPRLDLTSGLTFIVLQVDAQSTSTSQKMKSVFYVSTKYGFRFLLPESWKGYSIIIGKWEGGDGRTYHPGETIPPPVTGPLITIRHPLWKEDDPRQDIPIMIITKAQWRLMEGGKLIVSAAPFPPSELGRNMKYVFGLPPRFTIAAITGSEEVGELIQHHPSRPLHVN